MGTLVSSGSILKSSCLAGLSSHPAYGGQLLDPVSVNGTMGKQAVLFDTIALESEQLVKNMSGIGTVELEHRVLRAPQVSCWVGVTIS